MLYHQQHQVFISMAYLVFAAVCIFWIPLTQARTVENSKNEVHEGLGKVGGQLNSGSTNYYAAKRNLRTLLLNPKEYQIKTHGKPPLGMDLVDFLLEYEDDDRSKRFDDYGHMRFGKRGGEEQFDDYGHMRFGRSI